MTDKLLIKGKQLGFDIRQVKNQSTTRGQKIKETGIVTDITKDLIAKKSKKDVNCSQSAD